MSQRSLKVVLQVMGSLGFLAWANAMEIHLCKVVIRLQEILYVPLLLGFGTTSELGQWPWFRDWAGMAVGTQRASEFILHQRICTASLCTISSCLTGAPVRRVHTVHFKCSYFRKFNTKWQMNANYTSTAQLKPEMCTGSFNNPNHSSYADISKNLSLVSRDWQK